MTRAKSYWCEKDLRAAESKILKLAQVKFHYAAERNFILGKWLLEGNGTALISFNERATLDKILQAAKRLLDNFDGNKTTRQI